MKNPSISEISMFQSCIELNLSEIQACGKTHFNAKVHFAIYRELLKLSTHTQQNTEEESTNSIVECHFLEKYSPENSEKPIAIHIYLSSKADLKLNTFLKNEESLIASTYHELASGDTLETYCKQHILTKLSDPQAKYHLQNKDLIPFLIQNEGTNIQLLQTQNHAPNLVQYSTLDRESYLRHLLTLIDIESLTSRYPFLDELYQTYLSSRAPCLPQSWIDHSSDEKSGILDFLDAASPIEAQVFSLLLVQLKTQKSQDIVTKKHVLHVGTDKIYDDYIQGFEEDFKEAKTHWKDRNFPKITDFNPALTKSPNTLEESTYRRIPLSIILKDLPVTIQTLKDEVTQLKELRKQELSTPMLELQLLIKLMYAKKYIGTLQVKYLSEKELRQKHYPTIPFPTYAKKFPDKEGSSFFEFKKNQDISKRLRDSILAIDDFTCYSSTLSAYLASEKVTHELKKLDFNYYYPPSVPDDLDLVRKHILALSHMMNTAPYQTREGLTQDIKESGSMETLTKLSLGSGIHFHTRKELSERDLIRLQFTPLVTLQHPKELAAYHHGVWIDLFNMCLVHLNCSIACIHTQKYFTEWDYKSLASYMVIHLLNSLKTEKDEAMKSYMIWYLFSHRFANQSDRKYDLLGISSLNESMIEANIRAFIRDIPAIQLHKFRDILYKLQITCDPKSVDGTSSILKLKYSLEDMHERFPKYFALKRAEAMVSFINEVHIGLKPQRHKASAAYFESPGSVERNISALLNPNSEETSDNPVDMITHVAPPIAKTSIEEMESCL